jgi:ketosteroid isomerase-like protein
MVACPIEDRIAIEELLIAYADAVDSVSDLDGICAVFTEDADFDLSGIGLPRGKGHGAIRDFFGGVFERTSHHAHHLSNFKITAYGGDTASARAYVIGIGLQKDGSKITVHGRYYFDLVRTAAGWKASHYHMDFLLPLPDTLAAAHGD